jgi:hypothetical protein
MGMGNSTANALEYPSYVERLIGQDGSLADQVAGFHSVEHVLTWMQGRDLCRVPVDIIGQDEFEYDFLIQLESGGRWLSFGVT